MSFIIAPTDLEWFDFQRQNNFNENINFWTPTDWHFKSIRLGDRVAFKMKGAGAARIGGYGTFLEYKFQSVDDAWREFGRRNGFNDKDALIRGVGLHNTFSPDSGIGCLVLGDVVFFDTPVLLSDYGFDFSTNIVKYKKYDSVFPFENRSHKATEFILVEKGAKKKRVQNVTQREGQAQFHTDVSRAYGHKCCISGEGTPELLQAAHIQDYINQASHDIQNGLLLRIDLHTLFDNGLLAIDTDYMVHVSPLVESEEYRKYDGKRIALPGDVNQYPSKEALMLKLNSFRD
ncbi:MAG: HNH endonuclease [Paludibacteraceae bacterium]|nr:HNH endonuclease [Paludibacteraceae bacterium]